MRSKITVQKFEGTTTLDKGLSWHRLTLAAQRIYSFCNAAWRNGKILILPTLAVTILGRNVTNCGKLKKMYEGENQRKEFSKEARLTLTFLANQHQYIIADRMQK